MGVKFETYTKALSSAARQLEIYAHQGKLSTADERMTAMDDCLNHALGIIELEKMRDEHKANGDPRQHVNI